MPNDFESVGFAFRTPDEFIRFARSEGSRWPASPTPVGGAYVRIGGATGGQLWVQRSPGGDVFGAHPHFAGMSMFNASFGRVVPSGGSPLDGAIECQTVDDQDGVPLVVDVPNFRLHAAWLETGTRVVLQVAAFPGQIHVSPDETAHAASPLGTLASSGALIPSGTFRPGGEPIEPPTNRAILAGRIASVDRLGNAATGAPFWGVSLRTLGGTVDVPLDTTRFPQAPSVGAIMAGSFALSAVLVDPLPSPPQQIIESARQGLLASQMTAPATEARRPSLLRRLFGG